MKLTDQAISDFTKHVVSEYPREACGFIVGDNYVPCKNISADPLKHFRISADDYLKYEKTGELRAVLHSHPYDMTKHQEYPPEWPSTHDMNAWLAGNLPWGIAATEGAGITQIVWMDDKVIAPLEGREFIHGIHDCWSVIRDWYRVERNIVLPNYARGYGWWEGKANLYEDNFAGAGFVEVMLQDVKVGDLAAFQVRAPVINHCAVVVGTNQILHHLFHRLSGKDQLSKWHKQIRKYYRYTGKQ